MRQAVQYAKFSNYGLSQPDRSVMGTHGQLVAGTAFADIRAQALRFSPDERVEMLNRPYDPKISAGLWFWFGQPSRFHGNYKHFQDPEKMDWLAQRVVEMSKYGLKAVEAHEPWEINPGNLDWYKRIREEAGVVVSVIAGIGGDFRATDARHGTTSSPIGEVRDKYATHTVDQLELVKRLSEEQGHPIVAVCWPGIDGYTYPIGTDFFDMWDRFEAALAEAMDRVPGVRVAIEPKPYEPAMNNIWRHTPNGMIMARNVEARLRDPVNIELLAQGHALVGLNPEIGHVKMGMEDVPYAYASVLRDGRLAHTHINAQPAANFDQDLNAGVTGWEDIVGLLYVARMYGYNGFFGIDINPEKQPVEAAIAHNINAIVHANEIVSNMDHGRVLQSYHRPDQFQGSIEDAVLRARARGMDPAKLIPQEVVQELEQRQVPWAKE